jgi:hypothetical protein
MAAFHKYCQFFKIHITNKLSVCQNGTLTELTTLRMFLVRDITFCRLEFSATYYTHQHKYKLRFRLNHNDESCYWLDIYLEYTVKAYCYSTSQSKMDLRRRRRTAEAQHDHVIQNHYVQATDITDVLTNKPMVLKITQ